MVEVELSLEGFNYQNVLSGLSFEEVETTTDSSGIEVPRIQVSLDTNFGAWSMFSCTKVEVGTITVVEYSGDKLPYLESKNSEP